MVDSLATDDDLPVPNDVELVPVARQAVLPALLPLIDDNGFFRYPAPNVATDELALDSARVIAHEYLFYVLNIFVIRNAAENQRGAFIDLGKLESCNRPQLARSAFERPPSSLSRTLQLLLGSRWLIPFCGPYEGPEVIASVAALANQVRFQNGRIVGDSANQSYAFRVRGIRWEWKTEHMLTAEEAVNEVYAVSGKRAAALPEIVQAEQVNGLVADNSGICPVWRIALESSARVVTEFSLRTLEASQLFVADSDCPGVLGEPLLLVPSAQQPGSREIRVFLPDTLSPTRVRTETFVATYRAPVNFESVIIAR